MPPNVFKIHENKKKKKRHKQCLCVSLRRFRTVRYGSRAKKTRKIQIKMKNADRAWDRERESRSFYAPQWNTTVFMIIYSTNDLIREIRLVRVLMLIAAGWKQKPFNRSMTKV